MLKCRIEALYLTVFSLHLSIANKLQQAGLYHSVTEHHINCTMISFKSYKHVYFALIVLSFLCACDPITVQPAYVGFEAENFILPFELGTPDTSWAMKKKLKEISGLAYHDGQLFANNDEDGTIFILSAENGKLIEEYDFAKDDDYEGIAYQDGIIYVVESNGNIHRVNASTKEKIDDVHTYLSKRNNVEGLSVGAEGKLILACKGEPENKKRDSDDISLYNYDIAAGHLEDDPFMLFKTKDLLKDLQPINMGQSPFEKLSVRQRVSDCRISGVEKDPLTGDYYLLSNTGKILIVADESTRIKGVYFLQRKIFQQPEGITFDPEGNLFVSNEARSKKANILTFARKDMSGKTMPDSTEVKSQ